MNVGDYVRTKYGIALIENIRDDIRRINLKTNEIYMDKEYELDVCIIPDYDCNSRFCEREDIIKSSPNIIDLIEVGDYVDGVLVESIYQREKDKLYIHSFDTEIMMCFTNNNINSIVTKEQFEAMEYKVGE